MLIFYKNVFSILLIFSQNEMAKKAKYFHQNIIIIIVRLQSIQIIFYTVKSLRKISVVSSVTRLGDLFDFGQLFKAFGSN